MGEYMLDMCLILCTGAMDGIANPYTHCVCGFAGLGLLGTIQKGYFCARNTEFQTKK